MTSTEIIALYKQCCQLVVPYFYLEGTDEPQKNPTTTEGIKALSKGVAGLKAVVSEDTQNWPAFWMLGKAQQALSLHEDSYASFLTAHKLQLTNKDVMRELALECIRTKRNALAVHYCHVAMQFDPEDYTLWPNMAIAHLMNGSIEEAERWANKSLSKIPDDVPALNIVKIISEIKSGKRKLPTDFDSLEQEDV